jgi:hypothetical protein
MAVAVPRARSPAHLADVPCGTQHSLLANKCNNKWPATSTDPYTNRPSRHLLGLRPSTDTCARADNCGHRHAHYGTLQCSVELTGTDHMPPCCRPRVPSRYRATRYSAVNACHSAQGTHCHPTLVCHMAQLQAVIPHPLRPSAQLRSLLTLPADTAHTARLPQHPNHQGIQGTCCSSRCLFHLK